MDLRADCRTTDPFFYELQKSKKCIDNDEKNQMSYKKCKEVDYYMDDKMTTQDILQFAETIKSLENEKNTIEEMLNSMRYNRPINISMHYEGYSDKPYAYDRTVQCFSTEIITEYFQKRLSEIKNKINIIIQEINE